MENIIQEIIKIMKGDLTFIEKERRVYSYLINKVLEIFSSGLERLDDELCKSDEYSDYLIEKKARRTVTFMMGAVTFSRRRLVDNEGVAIYPLDELLGLQPRTRYSKLTKANVADLGSETVYRTTAHAINLFSNFTLSHQTVKAIIDETGKQIEESQNVLITELEVET